MDACFLKGSLFSCSQVTFFQSVKSTSKSGNTFGSLKNLFTHVFLNVTRNLSRTMFSQLKVSSGLYTFLPNLSERIKRCTVHSESIIDCDPFCDIPALDWNYSILDLFNALSQSFSFLQINKMMAAGHISSFTRGCMVHYRCESVNLCDTHVNRTGACQSCCQEDFCNRAAGECLRRFHSLGVTFLALVSFIVFTR